MSCNRRKRLVAQRVRDGIVLNEAWYALLELGTGSGIYISNPPMSFYVASQTHRVVLQLLTGAGKRVAHGHVSVIVLEVDFNVFLQGGFTTLADCRARRRFVADDRTWKRLPRLWCQCGASRGLALEKLDLVSMLTHHQYRAGGMAHNAFGGATKESMF